MKFDEVVSSQGFEVSPSDECVYMKRNGNCFIFLILYGDDILLVCNNASLLNDTKRFLSKHFEMKDMGETFLFLGFRSQGIEENGYLVYHRKHILKKYLKGSIWNTRMAVMFP